MSSYFIDEANRLRNWNLTDRPASMYGRVMLKKVRSELLRHLIREWEYSVVRDLIAALSSEDDREWLYRSWCAAFSGWESARRAYMLSYGFDSTGWPLDWKAR